MITTDRYTIATQLRRTASALNTKARQVASSMDRSRIPEIRALDERAGVCWDEAEQLDPCDPSDRPYFEWDD